jgi:ribosomal protein S4
MQYNLTKFKKNFKLIRLNRLYFDILKTKHILLFFSGRIKKRQLNTIYKVVSAKQRFVNFISKLENRIEFILLKSGFVLTGKQARQLVLHRHIFVNNQPIRSCLVALKLYDTITLHNDFILVYKKFLIGNLFKTIAFLNFLKKRKITKKFTLNQVFIYFKFPSFLEINFRTFMIILIKESTILEFFLPKVLSLYDCNQLRFVL